MENAWLVSGFPKTRFDENDFIMLSCLDVNMSCRLHLHVLMMKCAYVHDDITDHASHNRLGLWISATTLPRVHPYTSVWEGGCKNGEH